MAVVAALYPFIPDKGDEKGVSEIILKKYIWSAFFSDRYENSAATHAYYDYLALKNIIIKAHKKDGSAFTEPDVPIFGKEYSIGDVDEFLSAGWPKRDTIRGRAILAVACKLGSQDFATGVKLDKDELKHRHYHHIFPDSLLKEADINGSIALNCALISDSTNISIGRKDPLKYLKDRYKWTSEEIVNERLYSHLIPVKELANGGYEGLDDDSKKEKIKKDFTEFIDTRALLITEAVKTIVSGKALVATEVMKKIGYPN